jgi:Glycosyl hydrolase family 63 C-terminal domain
LSWMAGQQKVLVVHLSACVCHSDSNERMQMVRDNFGAPPKPQFVPHFGYNSLFPLALQLLPHDAQEVGALLEQLQRPDLLWTPYGLRSLAATSSLYMKRNTPHDAPYWRGAVWINVNFLVLRSLRECARCVARLRHLDARMLRSASVLPCAKRLLCCRPDNGCRMRKGGPA